MDPTRDCSSEAKNMSSDLSDKANHNQLYPVETLIHLLNNLNNKVEACNTQLMNKIDEKVNELKSDFSKSFVNFQREVKLHLESKQSDDCLKIMDLGMAKSNTNPISVTVEADRGACHESDDQVVLDIEPSAVIDQNVGGQISESNQQSPANSIATETVCPLTIPALVPTDSTMSIRINSANNTTATSVVPSCTLSSGFFQSLPLITVATTYSSVAVTTPVHSPVTKPLKTIKPKLTTEELIRSDYYLDAEDYMRPVQAYSEADHRFDLPGNPRVRTRGGIRRGNLNNPTCLSKGSVDCDLTPNKEESSRGGRRGRKPKSFPVIRRQSERLKKGESYSPRKAAFQESIADIEQFIWGSNADKSAELTQEEDSVEANKNKLPHPNKSGVEGNQSVLDSLSQIDSICEHIKSKECDIKNELEQMVKDSKKVPSHEPSRTRTKSLVTEGKGETNLTSNTGSADQFKLNNPPEDTPRNLPVATKKGLSLSSPRKGSHIRALDFSTPLKKPSPRRANTSPKAVSQVKLAQMRCLRRTNLFKSPVKKIKQSWDADLRAFVAPDIPLASANMRKRIQSKRSGRSKLMSPKKKNMLMKINKKKRAKKVLSGNEQPTAQPLSQAAQLVDVSACLNQDSPTKSTDDLVKQIERDVLEAIAEEGREGDCTESNIDPSSENNHKALESRTHCSKAMSSSIIINNDNQSTSAPPQISGSVLTKTPAKLGLDALISANLMTPVTKILKEQSSLLDNVNFLTPGFLPTPDNLSTKNEDSRKAKTPNPKTNVQTDVIKNGSNPIQSLVAIEECPVRIEDALAAEEQAVKPIVKESTNKTPKKKESALQKKSNTSSQKKVITPEKKVKKKKSFEESLIQQCLKNVEKDIFGSGLKKKSPSIKISNNRKSKSKRGSEIMSIKPQNNHKEKKGKIKEPPHILNKGNTTEQKDIRLPSFEEMMSRLSKMSQLSSSSSESSDGDTDTCLRKSRDETRNSLSNDSFPPLRVSEEESVCSTSMPNRNKNQIQSPSSSRVDKTSNKILPPKNPLGTKNKCSDNKELEPNYIVPDVSAEPTIKEQINDFSYYSKFNSNEVNFSFQYFDEGKNDYRTVQVAPTLHLFQFPFVKENCSPKTLENACLTGNVLNDLMNNHTDVLSKKDREFQGANINSLKPSKSASRDEIYSRARSVHSKPRDPRHSLRSSKMALSSHRDRYYKRSMASVERRRSDEKYSSVHQRHKHQRADDKRKTAHHRARSRSSERRTLTSYSRSDPRKENNNYYTSNVRSRKSKVVNEKSNHFFDKSNKTKIEESPNSEDTHITDKRKRIEEIKIRSPSYCRSDDRIKYCFLDPRVKQRNRESQDFLSNKPLAESTPLEKNKIARNVSSFKGYRSKQNHSTNTTKAHLNSVTREEIIKYTDSPSSLKLKPIARSATVLETIIESPSSPVEESRASPVTDPRLSTKLHSSISHLHLKPTKRKAEELEEGEISEDSVW